MAKAKEKPVDYSKPLKNAKHERFCQRSMIDLNASASYKEVYGCNTKVAEASGCRLLRNDKVIGRLKHLKSLLQKKTDITVESVMNDIADTHRRAKEAGDEMNVELKASDMMAKHVGAYEKDNEQQGVSVTDMMAIVAGKNG